MTPQLYFPDGQAQDGLYDEALLASNPFYAPALFAPPDYSQSYQSEPWQPHPSPGINTAGFQSWEARNIMNNHGPVMFDWFTSPVGPSDDQLHNFTTASHNEHAFALQQPPVNEIKEGPPLKFERMLEPSGKWQPTQWVQGIFPTAETGEFGRSRIDISLPVSTRADSPDRAAKRRRRSSTSTIEMQSVAPMATFTQVPLGAYTGEFESPENLQYDSTSMFSFPDHTSSIALGQAQFSTSHSEGPNDGISPMDAFPRTVMQTVEISPPSTAHIFQTSPPLTPSVRVISDRRDSAAKLRRGSDAVFKTQSANTKRGHYASDVWEGHKAAIKKMYIDDGKPLREVIKIMEKDHNFPATQRMYKARFKHWGFVKNNTEKVVSQILRTKFERDAAGKLSQFTRNGKDVNLQNYLQRKGLTEYDLVDFDPFTIRNTPTSTPSTANPRLAHVRCRTPPSNVPAALRLPDRLRFQDTLIMSFKRAFLLWRHEEQSSAFGLQSSVFTWRVTDFPHLSNLIESERLIRAGDGARGVEALNRAFWAMNEYLSSMDATASFYFFFHRQSRPWQEDARIALAVWKFLAAYAASAKSGGGNGGNHPLFHTFRLMYEVIQKEGVVGLRRLLTECANTVADELERAFGSEHYLKDLIWNRCFPEKSKLRQIQLVRDLQRHGPSKKTVKRLY